ncbi:MAG: DNRLRE domain-containing protein, partial [Anaerolineales bacterium]
MTLKIRWGLILAWLLALSARPTLTQAAGGTVVYLPIAMRNYNPLAGQRTVNAPYFNVADIGASKFAETAILWLGRVNRTDNYTDVRVAYNNTELYVQATTFDRLLWYDETPAVNELTQWDAVTLYLNTTGNSGGAPTTTAYRFVAQGTREQSPRTNWQTAYRGNGTGWSPAALSFLTSDGWSGESVGWNNMLDDKGWAMTFRIPFVQLGLSA